MPSTSRLITAEAGSVRMRIGIVFGALALSSVSAYGVWLVSAPSVGTSQTVVMENMAFSPNMVKVRRGDRIVFKNQDLVPHTATAKRPEGFDSGALKSGETWTFTVVEEGTIRYTCTFHPMMVGSIVVEGR